MNELTNVMENGEVKELSEKSTQLEKSLIGFKVVTVTQYEQAGETLKEVKGAQKRLESLRKSFTQPIDQAKTTIMDFFRKPEEKLAQAERTIKGGMLAYHAEQERIARETQVRLNEAARLEREKLEKQAAAAAAKGKIEKAAILEIKAALVSAPVVEAQQVKIAGQGTRLDWDFEIIDPLQIPRELCMPDEIKIRRMVKAFKEDAKIPGVRIFSKTILSSRSN